MGNEPLRCECIRPGAREYNDENNKTLGNYSRSRERWHSLASEFEHKQHESQLAKLRDKLTAAQEKIKTLLKIIAKKDAQIIKWQEENKRSFQSLVTERKQKTEAERKIQTLEVKKILACQTHIDSEIH